MGVRKPGFQLLSLVPPHSMQGSPSHADSLCVLPDQLGIYLSTYIPLLVFSLLVICAVNIRRICSPRQGKRYAPSGFTNSPSYVLSGALRSRSDTGGSTESNGWLQYPSENDSDALPRPTSLAKKISRPIYSRTFVLLGRRRRLTISRESIASLTGTIFRCCGNQEVPKSRGFVMGFLYDVRDVAIFPLAIFVALSWWMFR
jgi:hypothetical protein